jgi:hypothetical protein
MMCLQKDNISGFMTERKSNRNKEEANLMRETAGAPYATLLVRAMRAAAVSTNIKVFHAVSLSRRVLGHTKI